MSATLDFRLLGPFEAAADGLALALGGARRRAVLAMLALDAGRVVSTGRLIEGVWDDPPETAATALQGHVSQLRRVLGEDAILTRAPGYVLDAPREAVDAVRCELALERARAQLAGHDPAGAADTLREALGLWRGEPLADLADAPFARAALPALGELRVALEEERLEAELALGHDAEAIALLRELVAREPLRERPRGQLMLALYRTGRQAEALDVYEAGRHILSEELGIEPGERLRALHGAIVRQDAELAAPRPAAIVSRRRRRGAVAAAATVVAAAIVVVAIAASGGGRHTVAPVATGVVRVGAGGDRTAALALDGTPANLAAAGGHAWVLDADGQTVTEVGPDGQRLRTFATGATPTDIAASAGALWIAQGHAGSSQFPGAQTTAVAHVEQRTGAVIGTVELPLVGDSIQTGQHDRIAASDHAIWVLGADGALVRIDPLSQAVVRVLPLDAVAVTAAGDAAWAITRDGSLVRIAERGTGVGAPIDLGGTGSSSLAAGGGAVWVVDSAQGVLERYDADGTRAEPIDVGAGAGPVAYGDGTVWVAQPARETVLRVDADERRIVGEVRVGGTPRDVAADGGGLWASVTSPRATAAACGPLERAPGAAPDLVVAADLPLRTGGRSPIGPMIAAIRGVMTRHGYRAGTHRVGLLVCDDSTTQRGSLDPAKCRANERAYARDRRIVAEIGPYNSPCAAQQLPVAAAAPGGPLAVVSPTNTDPLLNRPGAGVPAGAYVRLVAADDRQAEVAARFLHDRGDRSVFVVDDGDSYGLSIAGYFAFGARAAGLRVVGRASWGGPRRTAAVIRHVRRTRPDAVFVSGLLDNGAGGVVRSLRRALGPQVTIAGGEGLLPVGRLFDRAGTAARGVLIATGIRPAPHGAHPFTVLAARATEVALDAIARSDGTRRSVARTLRSLPQFDAIGDLEDAPVTILRPRRPGGSRTNMSLEGGTVVAILR